MSARQGIAPWRFCEMRPLLCFRVNLAWRYWVSVSVWPVITDSPHSDGTEAAYLLRTRTKPCKLGELHFAAQWCDVGTITHEAYHVVSELRRRLDNTDTDHGEEWCARQTERLVERIRKGMG